MKFLDQAPNGLQRTLGRGKVDRSSLVVIAFVYRHAVHLHEHTKAIYVARCCCSTHVCRCGQFCRLKMGSLGVQFEFSGSALVWCRQHRKLCVHCHLTRRGLHTVSDGA